MGVIDTAMPDVWTPMGIYSGLDFSSSPRSMLGRRGTNSDPWSKYGEWGTRGRDHEQSTMASNRRHRHRMNNVTDQKRRDIVLKNDKDRSCDSDSYSETDSEGTSPPKYWHRQGEQNCTSATFPSFESLLHEGFVDIPIERLKGIHSNPAPKVSKSSDSSWNHEPYPWFQNEVGCNPDNYMDWGTFLKADLDSESEDESVVDNADEPWIPSLHLNQQDREDLVKRRMLSDKHVFAAQKLLREQFPDIGGFQDPCLAQTEFQPCVQEGVQIHHTRGNHWCVSSSLGGRVIIFDSIYYEIEPDLQKQLNEIYTNFAKEENGNVLSEMPYIPKQKGSKDCALFCIAIAYELCSGNDVQKVEFDQDKLRSHLQNCFEQGKLRPFPRWS